MAKRKPKKKAKYILANEAIKSAQTMADLKLLLSAMFK